MKKIIIIILFVILVLPGCSQGTISAPTEIVDEVIEPKNTETPTAELTYSESPMEINLTTPQEWGNPFVDEDDDEFMYTILHFNFPDDPSFVEFIATRHSYYQNFQEDRNWQYSEFLDEKNDEERVKLDSAKLYELDICAEKAIVFERVRKKNTTSLITNEAYFIDVYFILNDVKYLFSSVTDLAGSDDPNAIINQFWNVVSNIGCP